MSTRELVEAIIEGNSVKILEEFEKTMAEKISAKLQEAQAEYSRKMFRANANMDEQESEECPSNSPMRKRMRLRAGQMEEENLDEVLSKKASAGEWIKDFTKSEDPRFKGKSKEKRRQMALAAYYAKQRE